MQKCFDKHKVLPKCYLLPSFLFGLPSPPVPHPLPSQAQVFLFSNQHSPSFKAGVLVQVKCTKTENQPQQCISLPEQYAFKLFVLGKEETGPFRCRISDKISRWKDYLETYWIPCL